MSNLDFQLLESYLFAENRQDFVSKLVPGTESHYYFSILHNILTSPSLDKSTFDQTNDYNRIFGGYTPQNLKLRALLKKFDEPATTKQDKDSIIEELTKDYLHFNFNYPKPADIMTSNLQQTSNMSSTLDPASISLALEIEKIYSSVDEFSMLQPKAYTRLNTEKIVNGDINVFEKFVFSAEPTDFPDFPDLVIQLMKKKNNENASYIYRLLPQLSKEKLIELSKRNSSFMEDSEFVQALCKKEFEITSLEGIGEDLPKQERRDLLFKFYTWVTENLKGFPNLASNALYEILQLDFEMNKFSKDLFIEYLKNPITHYNAMPKPLQNALTQRQAQQKMRDFANRRIYPDELIITYLEVFFRDAKDTQPFNEYFESPFLNSIFYTTKLMQGEALDSHGVLAPEKLKALSEMKELKICGYNKQFYKTGDQVSITVSIKNIPSLTVKIFEFKAENYYLKEKKQLDGSINLDGLIAAEEYNYDFSEPPIQRFTKEFAFPSISEKTHCIYIIDFIGNGLSSRAVIRKGKLAFIEYQTLAGQLFEIVDDATNICKGKRTGIWIKDRFYKADNKGRILVPYSSNSTEHAVLVHDNMAELVDVNLKEEKFEFKCSYIYNYESFLMGNKAKVLVQPRLFINGQPAGLDVIHECSAVVTTTNDEGIPSRNTFNNVKLSVAEEIELEFGIPAKLAEANIQIKAKIFPVNKREPKEYTSQHVIPIELHKTSNSFYNVYLRYTKNGYELVVLGKTGESKPGLTVNLTLNHKYINRKFVQSLQTDKDGRIALGKLEDISLLVAELQSVGDTGAIKRGWKLNNQKKINYPENIRICQGDEIALPLGHNELSRHKVIFSRILSNKEVIRNELKSLKIDKRRLVISGLEEGLYRLYLKDVDQEISITVYKGKYWEQNDNFLYTDHTLMDTKQDTDSLIIGDIKVQPKSNSELADITIEAYADYPQRARFHVFAAQFMDPDMNRVVDDMNKNLPEHNEREAFLELRESQFINNRSLGDEYTYVLDRKNQTRFMGNTLEKPQILLKKTFVRDTQTTEEQLASTQQFEAVEIRNFGKVARSSKKKWKKEVSNGRCYDDFSSGTVRSTGDNFLNFLANPCRIYNNLKMDKEGLIMLKDFPYKKYSLLQIVGSNLSSNVSEIFPLESQDIQIKDLAQKAREGDSAFSVSRVSTHLPKGEKIQIKDLSSTEIQIMDSLAKLFTAQKNLALGSSAPKVGENYHIWEFLVDWEGLSAQEKLKKYDKFASHELNVFLYFKDRDFYNKVVLPFLQNKIEKTVVDYFLLNDESKMRHYAQAGNFQVLNPLEKILVILNIQRIEPGQAKSLAASLENEISFKKVDSEQYDRFFDTVLLSKKVEKEHIEHQSMKPLRYVAPSSCEIEGEGVDFAAYGVKKGGTLSRPRLALKDKKAFDSADYFKEKTSQETDDLENREFLEKRAQIQVGFQELEKTKEYTERHYYEQANKQVLFELNSFWVDVAKHVIDNGFKKPFISSNLLFAHSDHTEMISVLSLISLPFKAGNHKQSSFEGRGLELQAESELLIFSKAVIKTEAEVNEDILIRQRFFDPQDRHTESQDEPGLLIDKEVDQYIINKVYSSTVSVTNSSSYRQQVQVLVEIPEGSLPVKSLDYTKSYTSTLDAFGTRTYESLFYFPKPGKFSVIPPNVSKKGKVIAVGKKSEIEVKTEKTYASLETLTAILNKGSKDDILSFVKTRNIWNPKVFDFSAIYWLLTDKEFFLKFVDILRERKYFNSVVWQFGFYHKDEFSIKEYFSSQPGNTITSKFLYLDSSLLTVDNLKLLEYSPFVNKRVHVLADAKNRILNVQLKEQYKTFLTYLCERGDDMKTERLLGLVYYLLLQDRVQDAIKLYGSIDRERVRKSHQFELQYDYLSGYIDFYIGSPKFVIAREVCQKYLDYPVLSWRSLFVEIKNQLAEYDGEKIIENEAFSEEKKQNMENADKEETVSMEIHQSELHINHQNVREITLAFYRIDLEVLFSRSPFISQNKMEFSYIQANETKKIEILNPKGLEKTVFEIPQGLRNYNLYIELKTENKVLSTTYFSTSLQIQIIESYGQVKVLDKNNKPLSHVYVKCFAKDKGGKESFYKDGYTDLRGRFDYATLNSSDISNIQRFAIFVMSDEYGSLIREASPPNQLGRFAD